MSADWDVLIVGRSYAGLSAALNLGRARRSVLVVGSGGSRNESVFHVHGLMGQDGATPGAIITAAEKELGTYPTVELVDGRMTGLAAVDGGFRASIGKRTSSASMVILATGANDNPPAIPGLAEHWGRGVFTCATSPASGRTSRWRSPTVSSPPSTATTPCSTATGTRRCRSSPDGPVASPNDPVDETPHAATGV